MKQKIVFAAGLICAVACFCYYSQCQIAQQADPDSVQFGKQYHKATVDYGVIEPVLNSYKSVSGTDAIKKAVRIAWADAQKGDTSVFLVILAMQNQQLIEQNERMISILEKKK